MWQHVKLSEQVRPRDTLACCWDVKQPTNKQTDTSSPMCTPVTPPPLLPTNSGHTTHCGGSRMLNKLVAIVHSIRIVYSCLANIPHSVSTQDPFLLSVICSLCEYWKHSFLVPTSSWALIRRLIRKNLKKRLLSCAGKVLGNYYYRSLNVCPLYDQSI